MKKLLIIEDDADTVDIVKFIFEDTFHIMSFNDLIPIERIIEFNPDLIILDNRLSSGMGSCFCKEIKSNPITRFIPVLLFSADANLNKMPNEFGADAYLEKPFDIYELEKVVKKFAGGITN